jgi:tRNA (mo5U34)-methyltransferase
MAFIEHRFSGDPTNWWVANHAGIEAMLRSSGMKITGRPADEVYLCAPDPQVTPAWKWDRQIDSVFPPGGQRRPAQANPANTESSFST